MLKQTRQAWLLGTALVMPVALALVISATGCSGGSGATKAGGRVERQITLVIQTPDAPDADVAYFIRQVEARTDGRLRIVEGGDDYRSEDPDNEARLVHALLDGSEDMAYIPSRAWERASDVRSFRALQAPFLITDYAVLRRIATGSIGQSMLESLGRIDILGLGLVPNELRRPLARMPLISAAAFRDARIRVVTSPASVIALRALAAVPLTRFTSAEVGPALQAGVLDGVESSMSSIEENDYTRYARYLPSNLALFAKTQTIAIRRPTFDSLNARDRDALRAAAAATVAHADPAAHERGEVRRVCKKGLRLVAVSARALASLRKAASAAYAEVERDASTGREIAAITRIKSQMAASATSLGACRGR